jgi:quercetin dioxygenase-like cupin family protein
MSNDLPPSRFVSFEDAGIEQLPGRAHHWYCRPGMVRDTNLLMVRVKMQPGEAHAFHYHPNMEEILYFLSGNAEQWCDREKKILGPGDSLFIPAGTVHGTSTVGSATLDFLAILSPAKSGEPAVIDVAEEEPWKSLRPRPANPSRQADD